MLYRESTDTLFLEAIILIFTRPDAGAHMSEELKDASKELPRAMMWSITLNGILGITMVISFCFCIKDVEAFVNSVRYYNLEFTHQSTSIDRVAGLRLPHRRRRLLYHWLLRCDLRAHLVPTHPPLLLGGIHGRQLFSSDLELRTRPCKA